MSKPTTKPPGFRRASALADLLSGRLSTVEDVVSRHGVVVSTIGQWLQLWWRDCARYDGAEILYENSKTIKTYEDMAAWNHLAQSSSPRKIALALEILVENRESIERVLAKRRSA